MNAAPECLMLSIGRCVCMWLFFGIFSSSSGSTRACVYYSFVDCSLMYRDFQLNAHKKGNKRNKKKYTKPDHNAKQTNVNCCIRTRKMSTDIATDRNEYL